MSLPIAYAVGDVHGCAQAFDRVLAWIDRHKALHPNDAPIVLLGDLIDRGPDSRAVVERAMALGSNAILLHGNHEMMLEMAWQSPAGMAFWCQHGGIEALASYGVQASPDWVATQQAFKEKFPLNHRQFLRQAGLYWLHKHCFFSHAGLDPRRSLAHQQQEDLIWGCQAFFRTRLHGNTTFVHGHWASRTRKIVKTRRRLNVDTGAGFLGGALSVAVLDEAGGLIDSHTEPA